MREFQVCKKCLKKCDFKPKKFRKKLHGRLTEDDTVELTSCLKICPKEGVSFILRGYENEKRTRKLKAFIEPGDSLDLTLDRLLEAAGG